MKLAFVAFLAAALAPASTFDFAGLGTAGETTFRTVGLEKCVGSDEDGSCALSIKSFGGVPILHSIVTIKERHLQSLVIHAADRHYTQVIDAFEAKYGKPSHSDALPIRDSVSNGVTRMVTWTFLDGSLVVQQSDDRPQLVALFGSNRKLTPKIDF